MRRGVTRQSDAVCAYAHHEAQICDLTISEQKMRTQPRRSQSVENRASIDKKLRVRPLSLSGENLCSDFVTKIATDFDSSCACLAPPWPTSRAKQSFGSRPGPSAESGLSAFSSR